MYLAPTNRSRGRRLGIVLPAVPSGPGWRRFDEVVTERPAPGRYTIYLRPNPARPLNGLADGTQAVSASLSVGAAVGSKVAAPAITSALGVSGAAAGALTAGIGAGIAVLVSVLAGLWSAHEARIKGATQENQAINSAVSTFDQGLKAIFAAANSTNPLQNITGAQAAQQCQLLLQQFFAQMGPYTHTPGAADASNGGANCGSGSLNPSGPCMGTPGGHKCDNSCTATCCVGCQDLYPTILQALAVFNSPSGGSITACTVYSSKYGARQRSSYTLTYTPPAVNTAAGAVNSLGSSLSNLFGGSSSGTSSGTLLLLALAAGLGIYAFA